MKLRVGACALMLVLAGCSGESPESGMAGMRGVAASKATGNLPTSLPLARAIGASIANAPDRGALLSYPNKATPTKQEGAYTWFPTAISEAHAFKGIAAGEMTVPAPDGSQVKLRYERHVEEIDGNWTWIGRVVGGDQMQEAIITFGEKAVFGSIPQANGKPALSLQTRNGTVFAVQTDPSKVVSATKGHEDVMIPEAATLRSSMAAAVSQSAQVSQGATAVAQAAPPSAANTIDVAIGYTPEFATANGGASGASTRLVYLVQVGNQAFANSDVNGYLRIVSTVQVSYTNTNTNQTALQELTGSTGNSPVTIPATLAPLRAARDQYGADIAVLVRKFNTPENEGCGIAWLNGANQTAITAADAAWGYAVISDGYDTGTDGKTYYCADETLVHEAAHLMGSAHDRANSTTTGGALQYGRFAYSFGYKTSAAAGNFYTVMAYGDTGQIAHRIFSTPLKSTCGAAGNLACGVANNEDNARSLNQTIPVVAAFRQTVVPFAGNRVRNDFDGNGSSDLLWFNASQSTVQYSLLNGGQYITTFASFQVPTGFEVVGSGHFDEDLASDLLLVNPTTRSMRIWLNRGGYFEARDLGGYGSGWTVAAFKDLDGDGVSDILFQNLTTSNIQISSIKNGQITYSRSFAIPTGFSVLDVANVDGVGRSDLVLGRTSTREIVFWLARGEVFESRAFAQYGAGWSFAGTGDFSCDGTDDVVWTNESNRWVEFSYLSGGYISSSRAFTRPAGLNVAAIGNFGSDSCADLVMDDTVNRQVLSWKNNGSVFSGYALGGYSSGWKLL
jgi:hypothetical protein